MAYVLTPACLCACHQEMCRWDCVHRLCVRPSKCFDSVYSLMDQRVKEQGQKQVLLHNICRYASRFPHAEEVFGSAGSWPRAFSFCNHIPRVQFMGSKVVSFSASKLVVAGTQACWISGRPQLCWSQLVLSCHLQLKFEEGKLCNSLCPSWIYRRFPSILNAGPNCEVVEHLVSWTSLEPFQEFCWPFLVFLLTFWANFLSLCLDR